MAYASELLRDSLNHLTFGNSDQEPEMMAGIVAALVQLAHARGNTRQQIHEAIDMAWTDMRPRKETGGRP